MTRRLKIGLIGLTLTLITTSAVFAATKVARAGKSIHLTAGDMPSFPGGQGALGKYISSNLKNPDNKTKGTVTVRFVVTKDGEITNIKVMKSLSSECDREATRLITSMPKWEPATQKDEAIDSFYTLSITF